MPLRLSFIPIPTLHPRFLLSLPTSQFHTCANHLSDSITDHYATLELPHDASPASIKKQFYHLSKLHHPDHNPTDSTASARFVRISEAYATLGSPTKRERYDRDVLSTHTPTHGRTPRTGSYTSAASSSPFGARPASGLSKRRTQFRGPPPSFYRSGGWGAQGEKRKRHAEGGGGSATAGSGAGAGSAGMGPGQGAQMGRDDDVPHFDREGHFRTQEQQEMRRRRRMEEERESYQRGGSYLASFVAVGCIIALAGSMPMVFRGVEGARARARGRREEG